MANNPVLRILQLHAGFSATRSACKGSSLQSFIESRMLHVSLSVYKVCQHCTTGRADVQAAVRQEVRDAISPQHNCTNLDLTGVLHAY